MHTNALQNNGNPVKEESSVEDYISLLKPRVMALAVFSSISGLLLAPGNIHLFLAFLSIVCISIGAGASGAINMWYDKDIDSIMNRTKNRALPRGVIFESNALGFGIILAVIAIILLGLAINYFSALLLAISILFYVFIYTIWLKRRTHHNIVIGGAAGAFPPVIGWACVTGDISLFPVLLFLTIFFWTPPHFWALSLYKDVEYSKVNIPMLPVVKGHKETKKQIIIYSLILSTLSLAPYFFDLAGDLFFFIALFLNSVFLYFAIRVYKAEKSETEKRASALFKYSILYLYFYFSMLIFDNFIT